MERTHKRVLVISYLALMAATPNGRTMQSLVQGIPSENISLFTVAGTPDPGSCAAAYKVTNRDALQSLLTLSEKGGIINLESASQSEEIVKDTRQGEKKAWKYLMREMVWKPGRWNGPELKKWLRAQKPDCIIYMYGDGAGLQDFAVFASKYLNVPLIVYSCENYCFKGYNYLDHKDHSLPFEIYHRMSTSATKKLFKQASALISNSDALGKLYNDTYSIKEVRTVMMSSDMEFVESFKVRDIENTKVVYLGTLGRHRANALVLVAKALGKIDSRLKIDVYGKTNNQDILKSFEDSPNINYRGFVSYSMVRQIILDASLTINATCCDAQTATNKKYGFTTKFADSLACGTPFMLYAPSEMVETQFALEHKCAFVATEPGKLVETLKEALFDEQKRMQQLQAAKAVTAGCFNKERNIAAVNALIEKCIEDYGK